MKINFKSLALSLLLPSLLLNTQSAAAWGNTEYQSAEPYGNAQTPCFHGAITGSNTMTPEEEEALLADVPIKEINHFYGRISGNAGSLVLNSFKNRSIANYSTAGVIVATKARQNQIGLEAALGYFYDKHTRLEVEYLLNRSVNYNSNNVLINGTRLEDLGIPMPLSARVNTNTFLFNGYYDFIFGGYDRFRPFITLGVGPSFTNVRTNFNSRSITKQYATFAFGGGIGFRFNIFTRWSVVASFRYLSLGRTRFEFDVPATGPLGANRIKLEANYTYAPASIGIIYTF